MDCVWTEACKLARKGRKEGEQAGANFSCICLGERLMIRVFPGLLVLLLLLVLLVLLVQLLVLFVQVAISSVLQ